MKVQLCGRFEGDYNNIHINEYFKRKRVQYIIN